MTPNQYRIGIVVAGVLVFMGGTLIWVSHGLGQLTVLALITLFLAWVVVKILDDKPEQPVDGSRW